MTLSLDNWFINERITGNLDYYVLWGLGFGVTFQDDLQILAAGSRLGAGFDLFFMERRLEFFAQAVCEPYYGAKKKDRGWKAFITPVNFPCTAGIRLWFIEKK